MPARNTQPIPWFFGLLGDEEIAGVAAAIRDRHINSGPVCRELEARFESLLKVPHVVLTTSGSAALLLALLGAGVGPGAEVIIPAAGFIATAHAVLLAGARVRLVDVEQKRPIMDMAAVEAAMTSCTKAVVPVHLNGAACDISELRKELANRGIHIIEDAAQALMSHGPGGLLGIQGDYGAFSLGITKLISTGEGGLVATHSAEAYERLLKLRNQGVRLFADNVFDSFGFNLRFNDLLAAVGLAQVTRIEQRRERCIDVYRFYREALQGLSWLRVLECRLDQGELPLWTQVICAQRDLVVRRLADQGIVTRAFHPVLSASAHLGVAGFFPRAEAFSSHVLTLPSGPDQCRENLERTAAALHSIDPEISGDLDVFDSATGDKPETQQSAFPRMAGTKEREQ